jgi:SAM-dependent MidA family methyltransferase
VGLFIDYGRDAPGDGDTVQALRDHQRESPLANPGGTDITAHVDFPAFLAAATDAGAEVAFLTTQSMFLRGLGIEARAAALARANPTHADRIGRQLHRLTGEDQMGQLFKVACFEAPRPAPSSANYPNGGEDRT